MDVTVAPVDGPSIPMGDVFEKEHLVTKPRHQRWPRSLTKLNAEQKQTRENTQQLHKFISIYYDSYTKITLYFKLGY